MTYVLWSCYTSYNDPLHYAETCVRTIRNMCATIIIIVEKNLFFLQSRNCYIPSNTLLPKFHGSPLCAGSQHKKLNYLSHDTSAAFWISRDLDKDCANIRSNSLDSQHRQEVHRNETDKWAWRRGRLLISNQRPELRRAARAARNSGRR